MSDMHKKIGDILRTLRTGKAMSLEEVAERAGISADQLQKMEAQQTSPPLELIFRFAEIFGVPVSTVMGDSADSSFCLVRRNAGTAVSRFAPAGGTAPGYSYEGLGQQKKDRQMEPFLITLVPHEVHRAAPSEHAGEEFIFVVNGRVKVTLLDHTDLLGPGDSIYFDSYLPHTVVCDGDEPATILAVIHEKYEMIIL
jgi:transcriptional regulator with XRE-family HTH domain